jgi:pre-mRNA-processing factor 17
LEKYKEYGGITTYDNVPNKVKHMPKPKRQSKGDSSIVNGEGAYLGPWASYEEPAKDEDEEQVPLAAPTQTEPKVHKPIDDSLDGKETSTFHGSSEFDYLGRTYMHVPRDLDVNLMGTPGEQKCFLPKGQIHTWEGHEKGVSKLEFFPGSGHLLLSCGMDGLAKLWDVYHDRELLRSYKGHTKAIRDIKFNNDGTRFLTAGYDRYLKLWDTETGKCLQSINVGKIPYCATFNPNPDRQHLVLAGCSDKKIVQYDLNTGEVVQEYDQHLGGVNSITFVDDNRRFVTTSDDKTLRVWEFDIPVVIKYIAEPYMHSMPSVSKHPSNKWLAAQSLDNQILIFSATDRVKQNNKKSFKGHITSGFACQPNFSPDGKYLISGDASGSLWVWDWQTTKILKKIKAHDNALITCAWHPQETSKIATGSWDGSIKFWD